MNVSEREYVWGAQAASLLASAACRSILNFGNRYLLPATAGWQPALPGKNAALSAERRTLNVQRKAM